MTAAITGCGAVTAPGVAVRDMFAAMATGVAVITTASTGGSPVGSTIGSLGTLSLDPPLVLFCVQLGTRLHREVYAGARYGLSILDQTQERVARRFATSGPGRSATDLSEMDGVPVVDGALGWLVTRRHTYLEVGDHVVVTASVEGVRIFPERRPLVYASRQYRRINGPSVA